MEQRQTFQDTKASQYHKQHSILVQTSSQTPQKTVEDKIHQSRRKLILS